jgi:hypothetical protein
MRNCQPSRCERVEKLDRCGLIRLSGNGTVQHDADIKHGCRPRSLNLLHRSKPRRIIIPFSKMSCYYPGEMWAPDFYPCDPNADISLCCPLGWTCMSDGRCLVTYPETADTTYPIGTSYRGTCTSSRWDRSKCGNFCLGGSLPRSWIPLPCFQPCTNRVADNPVNDNSGRLVACGNNKFCCAPDVNRGTCNCTTDSGTFSLSGGAAQTVIGVAGLQWTQTPTVSPSFILCMDCLVHR